MKVLPVNPRGYCHGVVTAIRKAREVALAEAGPIYMLGYLVHNEHLTNDLEELGVQLIDVDDRAAGLEKITEGTVIFPAITPNQEISGTSWWMFLLMPPKCAAAKCEKNSMTNFGYNNYCYY